MLQCVETLRLFIDGSDKQASFRPRLESPNAPQSLAKPRRKVYVVHDGTDYLYVGDAGTSITERMKRGFRAFNKGVADGEARGGYWGYKWVGEYAARPEVALTLYVAVFKEEFDGEMERKVVEAVEAELVYLIRNRKGYWPKCQREIHFSNCQNAAEEAKRIFNYVEKIEGLKQKTDAF